MRKPNSVAIVSGGLDSITLTYYMIQQGMTPHLLSFNYGQRHKKELAYAGMAAKYFGLKHDIVDLSGLTHLISNSALTSSDVTGNSCICDLNPETTDGPQRECAVHGEFPVPEGHYAEDNMSVTVVPNRNMIMLSIAAGVAVNFKYERIATGVHGGDHFQYPDCRPEFIYKTGQAIKRGNEGFHKFFVDTKLMGQLVEDKMARGDKVQGDEGIQPIYCPFLYSSKADIATLAFEVGVPIHNTWSCYKGGENHCGRCGTCVERLEAINEAIGRMIERYPQTETVWTDSTVYDDNEYWRVEVAKRNIEDAKKLAGPLGK